ncbi:MAG: hypothetical protein QW320_09430 [Ignisphaera sp.]
MESLYTKVMKGASIPELSATKTFCGLPIGGITDSIVREYANRRNIKTGSTPIILGIK